MRLRQFHPSNLPGSVGMPYISQVRLNGSSFFELVKRDSDRGTNARGMGRKFLVLIWCVFLARGVFYSALLPIWEGYAEPIHFAFVQYLETTHKLPLPTTPVSRE